ncbi:UNVERIFIED_ORG: xanthine/uracil permease [Paenarthrobacter nicotinovorans]
MTEPSVNLQAVSEPAPATTSRPAGDFLWLIIPAVSGIVVGLLWWLLAPGGLNLVSGNPDLSNPDNPESWLPRDLVLAALMLVSGCATGLMLDGKLERASASRRLVFALLGGAAGALLAWLTGLLAAQLWGPPPNPALGPGYGFTLRSYAVLLLWTGATAFVTFILSLFGVLSKKPVK